MGNRFPILNCLMVAGIRLDFIIIDITFIVAIVDDAG